MCVCIRRVFWDKECLARGVDWEKDFRRGLKRACLYLPLISDAGQERVCICRHECTAIVCMYVRLCVCMYVLVCVCVLVCVLV